MFLIYEDSLQSAVMAGLKVVPVKTHADGDLDLEDLKTKAEKHKNKLAAFMVRISRS
jgi:glycine dehydrogenase